MIRIEQLDPHDETLLREWHAVYEQAERHGRQYARPYDLRETRVTFQTPSISHLREATLVRMDGRIVAAGAIGVPQLDHADQCDVQVHVLPAYWRRGIGRAVALDLAARARGHGRRLWNGWIPGPAAPTTGPTPGEGLAVAMGMRCGLRDLQRRLALPVDQRHLDALAADAAPHHAAYELRAWVGPCPEALLEAYGAMRGTIVTEAPAGELEVEDEVWSPQRLREQETELVEQGRTRYTVVALAPDGSLAGHNELVLSHDSPTVFQWDTLVVPAHRGRRLGMALKVANLTRVQAAHPERTEVSTYNAVDNGPMNAVNAAIGFEPVEEMGEWQGPVPA